MTCEHCHEYVTKVVIHDKELWCVPCHETAHVRSHGVIQDSIEGGVWIENLGPKPVKVYSQTERKRLMQQTRIDKATGAEYTLAEYVRHVPGSKLTTNWATMDPQTLENARVLVSRGTIQANSEEHTVRFTPINQAGTLADLEGLLK